MTIRLTFDPSIFVFENCRSKPSGAVDVLFMTTNRELPPRQEVTISVSNGGQPILNSGICDDANTTSCFMQCAFRNTSDTAPGVYPQAFKWSSELTLQNQATRVRNSGGASFTWNGASLAIATVSAAPSGIVDVPVTIWNEGGHRLSFRQLVEFDDGVVDVVRDANNRPACVEPDDNPCGVAFDPVGGSGDSSFVANIFCTARLDIPTVIYRCPFVVLEQAADVSLTRLRSSIFTQATPAPVTSVDGAIRFVAPGSTPVPDPTPSSFEEIEILLSRGTLSSPTGDRAEQFLPRIDARPDGSSWVAWQNTDVIDGFISDSIFARQFSADVVPLGDEFQVSAVTETRAFGSKVAVDASGGAFVIWTRSRFTPSFTRNVDGRRFDSEASAIDDVFPIDTATNDRSFAGDVATYGAGNAVVVWSEEVSFSPRDQAVYFRRYDLQGELGGETRVNGPEPCNVNPSVAADTAGNFVVVWVALTNEQTCGLLARLYDPQGVAQGDAFVVSQESAFGPRIAMDASGTWAVAWQRDEGIAARVYDLDGVPLTPVLAVDGRPGSPQIDPAVAVNGAGFVVVWTDLLETDVLGQQDIVAQRFDFDGQRIGEPFRVNQFTFWTNGRPDVALSDAGTMTAVWESELGILARRFATGISSNGAGSGTTALNP